MAGAARAYLAPGEEVAAVLIAEPPALERVYLCALRATGDDEAPLAWVAFDESGAVVDDARLVREAATIEALCESAEEAALAPLASELAAAAAEALTLVPAADDELRAALEGVRSAALALDETTAGLRVAHSAYVDRLAQAAANLGAALTGLRAAAQALSATLAGGDGDAPAPLADAVWGIVAQAAAAGSPDRFADAVSAATAAIDALANDVVLGYRPPLRDQRAEGAT